MIASSVLLLKMLRPGSLWQCWAVVYWELCSEELRATCWGYTTWTRSSLLRSQGGDHHSCFTILLAVCLVLRRETSVFGPCFFFWSKSTKHYMCRHCPDTAIHDNTSCISIIIRLKMIQFFPCRIGTMTSWDACKPTVGFTAALTLHSNGWTKLWSPPSGFGCKVYQSRDCSLPGMAAAGCRGFFCVKAVKVIKDDCCTF